MDFILVIIYITIALLEHSQVQAQTSYSWGAVDQTSLFIILDTFFSPTPEGYGSNTTSQVSVSASTSSYTWDCNGLISFILGPYCEDKNDGFNGYTFSVNLDGTSTYPYTVGDETMSGYSQ